MLGLGVHCQAIWKPAHGRLEMERSLTHRVDDVRQINDSVRYARPGPLNGLQSSTKSTLLSAAAFNAFLKTWKSAGARQVVFRYHRNPK